MILSIREVRFEDEAPVIISMDAALFDAVDAPFPGGAGFWWLVYDEYYSLPIGYANLRRSHKWADCGFLARAGLLPEARGHGVQKRLIRARIAKARRIGWSYLITNTYRNPASVNSLIACGFKAYIPTYKWAGADAQYWRRKI